MFKKLLITTALLSSAASFTLSAMEVHDSKDIPEQSVEDATATTETTATNVKNTNPDFIGVKISGGIFDGKVNLLRTAVYGLFTLLYGSTAFYFLQDGTDSITLTKDVCGNFFNNVTQSHIDYCSRKYIGHSSYCSDIFSANDCAKRLMITSIYTTFGYTLGTFLTIVALGNGITFSKDIINFHKHLTLPALKKMVNIIKENVRQSTPKQQESHV